MSLKKSWLFVSFILILTIIAALYIIFTLAKFAQIFGVPVCLERMIFAIKVKAACTVVSNPGQTL